MATLCFGRHETHILYLPPSCNTQISKQVPYCPPSTGFPAYFSHPSVCVSPKIREGRSSRGVAADSAKIVINSLLVVVRFVAISTSMPVDLLVMERSLAAD
jgi:hypothetical protein